MLNQEEKISEFSFIGLINKAAKNLLIGNKEKCSKLNEKLNKTSNNKLYYCFLFAKLIDMLRTGGENNNS